MGVCVVYQTIFHRVSVSIFLFLAAVMAWSASPVAHARDAKKPGDIPVEAFAQLPAISNPKLSPDGSKVAFLANEKGRVSLTFLSLNGKGGSRMPPPDKMDIRDFHWANDETLLIEVGTLWNRAEFVGPTYNSWIISYNIKTKRHSWMGNLGFMPLRKRHGSTEIYTSQRERLVDILPSDPTSVLIEFDFDVNAFPEVFRVDHENNRRISIRNEKKGILRWYTDSESKVRFGVGFDQTNNQAPIKVLRGLDGDWNDFNDVPWSSRFIFQGFAKDKNQLFVSGLTGHGTLALYRIDAASGDVIEEVAAHQSVDIDGPVFHPLSRHLTGVTFTDDFHRITNPDPGFAKVQERIDYKKRGHVNTIIEKARNSDRYLFEMHSDTVPSIYYLYDVGTDRVKRIGKAYDGIDLGFTAPTKSVSIPVTDGSTIPGYMTIPHGREASNMPTIILPHGGPTARDDAEWDYWAQFYASRGYLVIKPNFRGSTGYGQDFRLKGREQWGGLMQDDITDATKWAIAEGYADPERICIVGASFGGYAALMGAVKEPGLYKCAVSINGVTNLPAMKAKDERYVGGDYWIQFMGLEGTDDKEVSPYHRAEEIQAPVLLVSAKDDARIPYRLSEDMHKRLRKLGKQSHYVKLEQGGHSLMSEDARLTMLTETEKFLKAHIGSD